MNIKHFKLNMPKFYRPLICILFIWLFNMKMQNALIFKISNYEKLIIFKHKLTQIIQNIIFKIKVFLLKIFIKKISIR